MSVKILIVRFSSIGDIVLTTPVIRNAKQQLNGGDVEVHYLTKKQFVPILMHNPYIDKLHTIDKHVSEAIEDLKSECFDYVIDLHKNVRSGQVKRALGTLSFTFKKFNIEKWVYVNFKVNRMPDVHIVDRYMDTLSAFSIQNDLKGLDYFIAKEDEIDFSTWPDSHQKAYIGFVIGGQHPGKMMPVSKIVEICKMLTKPVVLIGGPDDREKGNKIAKVCGSKVFNTCGKYKLNTSAFVVKHASAIIAHDTGLMHVAAAYKKKIVSIWGATVPEFGMYPYLPGEGSKQIEPVNCWDRPSQNWEITNGTSQTLKGCLKLKRKRL